MSIALALPTRRVEEWKYSDLARALGDAGFGEETARAVVAVVPAGMDMFDLDEPNRPDWVKSHYGKLPANAVSAVSLAKARGGIALRVPKGRVIEKSLALTFAGKGHVRVLLVLEEGAVLTLTERSDAAETRNMGMEIVLGPNAQLNHVRLSPVSPAVQVEEVAVTLARSAVYRGHFAQFWRQAFAPRTGYRAGR